MYLHESITDREGNIHEMCGVVKGGTYYSGHLLNFGYINITYEDFTFPAHEFHYYGSDNEGMSAEAKKPGREKTYRCCHIDGSHYLGFPHLYFKACPGFIAYLFS